MDSSDPSDTGSAIPAPNPETSVIEERDHHQRRNHTHHIEPKNKSFVIAFMVFYDLLIPIFLLFLTITTLSIVGLIMLILLILHVMVMNLSTKKISAVRVLLCLEELMTVIILIFSIIMLTSSKEPSETIKFIGLEFNNCVSKSSVFALVASAINLLLEFIVIVMIQDIHISDIRIYQIFIYSSRPYKYISDLIWYLCLAYISSSNSSVFLAPLLLYFAYTSVTYSISGNAHVWRWLVYLINVYGILYSGFILYQLSPIGKEYSVGKLLGWAMMTPEDIDALLVVVVVIFAYICIESITSHWKKNVLPLVPRFMKPIGKYAIVVSYILVFLFACYFPSYLAMGWFLIIIISVFFDWFFIKHLFFRILSIYFILTFLATAVTSYGTYSVKQNNLMRNFGLFIYERNLSFLCCGFFLVAFIGQVGRIVFLPREKMHPGDHHKKSKLYKGWLKFFHFCMTACRYIAVGAIIIIGIVCGFYRDRYAFQIIFCLFLIIALLTLYHRWVFYTIKLLVGLLILANCFFYVTSIDMSKFPQLDKTGLKPTGKYSLFTYTWSIDLVFLLAIFVTSQVEVVMPTFPKYVAKFLFFLSAAAYFVILFIEDMSIFTLFYFYLGIMLLAFNYYEYRSWLLFTQFCSQFITALNLVIKMFSHLDPIRNLITTVITKPTIIDVSEADSPTFGIAVLGFIIFINSIAFRSESNLIPRDSFYSQLMIELKNISRMFFFYISWIFMFGFSVVNRYPTFIKFLSMALFFYGAFSASVFIPIRVPVLIFYLILAGCQICLAVFEYEDDHSREIMRYVGLYWSDDYSKRDRNKSLGWQLAFILMSVFNQNIGSMEGTSQEFNNLLVVRIFFAICSCFHNWLPVIVEICLLISAMYNPSLFGWISFIVLCIVAFNDKLLAYGAKYCTLIFNLTFAVQYLLWLGCPRFLFYFRLDGIINKWGVFLGIVDVKISALISNCISGLVFTFYLQYHLMFVDYKQNFDCLPSIIKDIVNWFTTYVFEICTAIIIIVASLLKSFDGLFFLLLACALLFASILLDYDPMKSMRLMSWYTFLVLGAQLVSRVPVFTNLGKGYSVKNAFNLPFQGSYISDVLWIVIFAFERFCIHIMRSNIFKSCSEFREKHAAYKFIRNRQIAIINQLDQEILKIKNENQINLIKSLSVQTIEEFYQDMQVDSDFIKIKTAEVIDTNQDKHWYTWFLDHILYPLVDRFITVVSQSLPINSEAGINVLTLETLIILMKRYMRACEMQKELKFERREIDFLKSLPPSFKLHFNSLGDVLCFNLYSSQDRRNLFIRYALMLCRRIAFPFLILMAVIYAFMKPYLYAVIFLMFIYAYFVSMNIHGYPSLYRLLLGFSMFILVLRSISQVTVINKLLVRAANDVANIQTTVPLLNLIGLGPEHSITVEIFLFLATLFFVVSQLASAAVFHPRYYYNKFKTLLPGFPDEYCYGVISNPEIALGLQTKVDPMLDTIKHSMEQVNLKGTSHSMWLMFIDFISFLVLLICWNRWTNSDDSLGNITEKFVFSFNVLFIFMLIIHVVFTFSVYYCVLSYKYFEMFWVHLVWLLWTILMSFFFVPSQSRKITGSLKFYLVLRYLSHLIAGHKIFIGKINIAFKYPNFKQKGKVISWTNQFIRACPFAFEIQTLLLWMSQYTYVSLTDYFIIRDIKGQIEILMAEQARGEEIYVKQHRYLIGGIGILLLLILLFGPLFFMVKGSDATITNPPVSAKLEIGFSSILPFYKAYATISDITTEEHQQIADADLEYLKSVVIADKETLSLLEFPFYSLENFIPTEQERLQLFNKLQTPESRIIPYYRFSLIFGNPTSIGMTQNIVYQKNGNPLSSGEKEVLLEMILSGQPLPIMMGLSLPILIYMPAKSMVTELDKGKETIALEFRNISSQLTFNIDFLDDSSVLNLLNPMDGYKCLLWSQPVDSNGIIGSFLSANGGMAGIYILIVLTFGEVLRERTLSFIEDLWIERIKNPDKIYRMIISIEAFRIAKEPEKEKDMTERLLDTLRSPERVIMITDQ